MRSVVMIDSQVSQYQTLLATLPADSEILILNSYQDGVGQIVNFLSGQTDIDALHIISHGTAGAIQLGGSLVNTANLTAQTEAWAGIGQALTADGDILLYGCDVAQGGTGLKFITQLATITGADVAASIDPTGTGLQGGDWELESSTGTVQATPINESTYSGLLDLISTPLPRSYPDKSGGECRNYAAFAALRDDGSVVTWGASGYGGDSSAVATALNGDIDVTQIFSSNFAFAALRADGSVVTWGQHITDSGSVPTTLNGNIDIIQIYSTYSAFAALRADGSVVTWGGDTSGGLLSTTAATALNGDIDVTQIFSSESAFAALRADGSVVAWGGGMANDGGASSVKSALNGDIDVTQIYSTSSAFAAIRADGSVVTWGSSGDGGGSSAVATALNGDIDVTQIGSTWDAFAAIRADGSVVTWGGSRGGDSSSVATALNGDIDVTQICSTGSAFAALRADGSVVTWGYSGQGGDSSAVATLLDGDISDIKVTNIFSTKEAFAALRADGSVVTWGFGPYGGNSSTVAIALDGDINVTQIFSTGYAFAALRTDGSVVTWGAADNSAAATALLNGDIDVTNIFSTSSSFAALRADGSVVTWGVAGTGGDSSAVASQLTNVVSMANPYTNDIYPSALSDLTAPALVSFSPTDGATNVATTANITLTFNEAIMRGAGNIVLKTAAGTVIETFDVATSSRLSISGAVLTIDPTSALSYGTNYYVTIGAATVKDIAGNSYAGTTSYDFVTATGLTLNGTAGNDVLTGAEGNDTINGGLGADTMAGGLGNDTYVVDNLGDVVTESSDAGTDTVKSSINYTLGANLENLTQTGTGAINGTGNTLANTLTGNSGNNILNGMAGNDTMRGGLGNDTYIVNATGDKVTEGVSQGTDTVKSAISYTLGANLENLTLTGAAAINGTGNEFANALAGNSGANILNGGLGADTLIGGLGNDTYYVDNAGDVVTEKLNEGTDTVNSSMTYTLGANLENLTLTGTANINGTGNSLNNIIRGNAGANVLNGSSGADTLIGGLGNDTYYVDNAGDVVTETLNEGTDTVRSSKTYTLGANLENLTLSGTANINGTGNSLKNIIRGNTGANVLNGSSGNDILSGGSGNDSLTGGAGLDSFVFDTTLNASTNIDTITDFLAVDDTIRLDQTVFSKLTTLGALSNSFFRATSIGAAMDDNDYILYNSSTGALFYDMDGNGASAAIQFTTLATKPGITAADFVVVA